MTRVNSRAAKSIASALYSYLRLIGSTLQVQILLPNGTITTEVDGSAVRQAGVYDSQHPIVLPLWTIDQVNLLATAFRSPNLRDIARGVRFFVDDSFGGVLMNATLERLRLSAVSISDRDPVARLRNLRSFITSKETAFVVVDGRGPYFHVGSGIINLAHSINAAIVPCSASASAAFTLRGRSAAVAIPLPWSRIVIAFGEPRLFGGRTKGITSNEEAERLQAELMTLGVKALALASSP